MSEFMLGQIVVLKDKSYTGALEVQDFEPQNDTVFVVDADFGIDAYAEWHNEDELEVYSEDDD